MLRRMLAVIALFAALIAPALADCTTPTGYKRLGSSYWRITEGISGSLTWERLPRTTPSDVPASIKTLALQSTGIAIHIRSDTDALRLCWTLSPGTASFPLWSETGASGIDVYFRAYGSSDPWKHLTAGSLVSSVEGEITIGMGSSADREYLIYAPQYRRVALFRVEVPTAATVSPGTAPSEGPLVVLGTSITQGSGTSRAGIGYPQALGRHYGVDTINLGFVGSCQMPVGLATLMATADASAYYLDCFPNMCLTSPCAGSAPEASINGQLEDFLAKLADNIPSTTPIYIVEERYGPLPSASHDAKSAAAYAIYLALKPTYPNLYWLPADDLLGSDGEALIDDSHPSDLGHSRYTQDFIAQVSGL